MASTENSSMSKLNEPAPRAADSRWTLLDTALLAGLSLFAVYFLAVSWRKWPDPVIDFGHQLYVPWRLSQGAVLYEDMQYVYGPLSQYFNSLLFKLAGVGFTTLIAANLTIYAGILALLYYLVRAGWGRLAASVAGAIFVAVFSFSHIGGIGNFNYAAPYAHEATHGVLVTLLLVFTWLSALERFARWKSFLAGVLAGLCLLLKPEFIIAAVAVTGAAMWLLARDPARQRRTGAALCFVLGTIVPLLAAVTLFRIFSGVPLLRGLEYANNAWVIMLRFPGKMWDPMQQAFLGTKHLSANLLRQFLWSGFAIALAGGVGWGCRRFNRAGDKWLYLFAGVVAAIGIWLVWTVDWTDMGAAFVGLLALAALLEVARGQRSGAVGASTIARVLLWSAAVALLSRMAFNPRVNHFGFYQAPLAAAVGIATLVAAVPEWFGLAGVARKCYQALLVALILCGGGAITPVSLEWLSAHDLPVADGSDRFYAFNPQFEPTGALVEAARQYLAADSSARTLVVLPEGIMLNYLTRLPSPLPFYLFDPAILTPEIRRALLEKLRAEPPDRVVIVSRDMSDFGVERFGDSLEHGQELLEFVQDHYQPVFRIGGDPLDVNQRGVIIAALRPAEGSAPAER
jgi:hypothetical protein